MEFSWYKTAATGWWGIFEAMIQAIFDTEIEVVQTISNPLFLKSDRAILNKLGAKRRYQQTIYSTIR